MILQSKKCLEGLKGEKVALYGAGKYGRQALENLKKYYQEIQICCFLDDNKVRNNSAIEEIEILSLREAMNEFQEDFYILITNYYVSSVLKKLEENGFELSKVFFCNEILIEDISKDVIELHKKDMENVYHSLTDYKSKLIYRTMAESRFTKDIASLSCTADKEQYFPVEELWNMGNDEVFVDAGAFDGDTIEQFLKFTHGAYRRIYAFEPDKTNCQKLKENNGGRERIEIFNAGLYDESKKLYFSANKGGSSKIQEDGTEEIQVYCFDELELPDKRVTFVKMDIEGSELKALEGMKKTIMEHKPKLAICIYHKYEDLWEIPLYIKQLVPEYKLYIRNYTTYLDEIVLYATL